MWMEWLRVQDHHCSCLPSQRILPTYIGTGTLVGVVTPWRGDIDEVYLFNTELSAAQVSSHFAGSYFGDRASVRLWMRMNDAVGATSLADESRVSGASGTVSGVTMNPADLLTGLCMPLEWSGY